MNTQPTIQDVNALYSNPVTVLLIAQVTLAQAEAEDMRAKVDAYSQPILDAAGLVNDYDGTPITKLSEAWTAAEDDKATAFYKALEEANHANGFAHYGERCPALVMESLARDAERNLVDHARKAFGLPEIYNLDIRKRLLNLVMNPPMR